MSDAETNSGGVVSEIIAAIPAPVQHTFIKTLSKLVGSAMAVPAAKLKQLAQGIDDTTNARSSISAALAQAVSQSAIHDPVVMQAAAEVLLPDSVRKVRNRLCVAHSAAQHIADQAAAGASTEGSAIPDEDWMNSFMRNAEDASSERLQDLFGRILAGEVLRPGAFSLTTLRAVRELDQQAANDFIYAWSKSVGDAIDYSTEWQRGDGFLRWKRLAEAGLMATSSTAQFLPPFVAINGDLATWTPFFAGPYWLTVWYRQGYAAQWDHIDFTRVGREVGKLLDEPNYKENMRQAALRLPTYQLAIITLNSPSSCEPEIILRS